MNLPLCAYFILLLLACAISDARRYRIPDAFTAPLFIGAMTATLVPGWIVSTNAALAGFLFSYPVLFLLWSGKPLPVLPLPTEGISLTPDDGSGFPYWRQVLSIGCVPSPLTWIAVLILGMVFVDWLLWMAIPVGLIFCLFTALKVSPAMPWHHTRFSSSWLGGGDTKMLAACITLLGMAEVQHLSLALTIANVLLIVCLKFRRRNLPSNSWEARRVPMGVAIAASATGLLIVNVLLAM